MKTGFIFATIVIAGLQAPASPIDSVSASGGSVTTGLETHDIPNGGTGTWGVKAHAYESAGTQGLDDPVVEARSPAFIHPQDPGKPALSPIPELI